MTRCRSCAAALSCWLLMSAAVRAQDEHSSSLRWQPHWPRVNALDYTIASASLAAALAILYFAEPRSAGLRGGALYDDEVRDWLRASDREGRDAARFVGDQGFRLLFVYPILDAAISSWAHGSGDVAWQTFVINAEALALAGVVGLATDHFIGRGRPSLAECERDGQYERFCGARDEYGSFISGHTAIAAAGAGLTCAHHLHLPLYGGGAGDVAACVAATALALATGTARIVNDRHWATDVTAGLIVGAAAGYVLPTLMHYPGREDGGEAAAFGVAVLPTARRGWLGLDLIAIH